MSEVLAQLEKKGTTENFAKGSFTSASTEYGTVTIDLGFRPKHVSCWFAFTGESETLQNVMSVIYDEDLSSTQSRWVLNPRENVTHYITLGSSTSETGISDITDSGFVFRAKSANCRGTVVNYVAY